MPDILEGLYPEEKSGLVQAVLGKLSDEQRGNLLAVARGIPGCGHKADIMLAHAAARMLFEPEGQPDLAEQPADAIYEVMKKALKEQAAVVTRSAKWQGKIGQKPPRELYGK